MTNNIRIQYLAKFLRLESQIRIVDIGANPMQHDPPYKTLLELGLCHVIGFEPQEAALNKLNQRKGPNELYLPDAVGDGAEHTLNLYRGSGLVSLLKLRQATLDTLRGLRKAGRYIGSETLKTSPLDNIKHIGRIDFLKIDIQGGEVMVFNNAKKCLKNVVAVQTEVCFFPLYEDQPMIGEIDVILRRYNLIPHSFVHIVKRIVLSRWGRGMPASASQQMLDGDLLYFRDFSRPSSLTSEELKRLALLADSIYNAFDVTFRCLEELEARDEVLLIEVEKYASLIGIA